MSLTVCSYLKLVGCCTLEPSCRGCRECGTLQKQRIIESFNRPVSGGQPEAVPQIRDDVTKLWPVQTEMQSPTSPSSTSCERIEPTTVTHFGPAREASRPLCRADQVKVLNVTTLTRTTSRDAEGDDGDGAVVGVGVGETVSQFRFGLMIFSLIFSILSP